MENFDWIRIIFLLGVCKENGFWPKFENFKVFFWCGTSWERFDVGDFREYERWFCWGYGNHVEMEHLILHHHKNHMKPGWWSQRLTNERNFLLKIMFWSFFYPNCVVFSKHVLYLKKYD